MKVQFKGFVRDIYVSDKDKNGNAKTNPVHYITFVDMETGGDVKLSFPEGHGLAVGQQVNIDAVVKGRTFSNSVGYHVEQLNGSKPK
ncbi:MAG: hypothetical protein HZB19_15265 [Chloroflexi bacterium]|nr:hypothetical protein [Chloroflexota bacterium]